MFYEGILLICVFIRLIVIINNRFAATINNKLPNEKTFYRIVLRSYT